MAGMITLGDILGEASIELGMDLVGRSGALSSTFWSLSGSTPLGDMLRENTIMGES